MNMPEFHITQLRVVAIYRSQFHGSKCRAVTNVMKDLVQLAPNMMTTSVRLSLTVMSALVRLSSTVMTALVRLSLTVMTASVILSRIMMTASVRLSLTVMTGPAVDTLHYISRDVDTVNPVTLSVTQLSRDQ